MTVLPSFPTKSGYRLIYRLFLRNGPAHRRFNLYIQATGERPDRHEARRACCLQAIALVSGPVALSMIRMCRARRRAAQSTAGAARWTRTTAEDGRNADHAGADCRLTGWTSVEGNERARANARVNLQRPQNGRCRSRSHCARPTQDRPAVRFPWRWAGDRKTGNSAR